MLQNSQIHAIRLHGEVSLYVASDWILMQPYVCLAWCFDEISEVVDYSMDGGVVNGIGAEKMWMWEILVVSDLG